jgi:hypothetical protein
MEKGFSRTERSKIDVQFQMCEESVTSNSFLFLHFSIQNLFRYVVMFFTYLSFAVNTIGSGDASTGMIVRGAAPPIYG